MNSDPHSLHVNVLSAYMLLPRLVLKFTRGLEMSRLDDPAFAPGVLYTALRLVNRDEFGRNNKTGGLYIQPKLSSNSLQGIIHSFCGCTQNIGGLLVGVAAEIHF